MDKKEAQSRAVTTVVFGLAKHEIGSEPEKIQLAYLQAVIEECQKRIAPIKEAHDAELHQRLIAWIRERGGKATAREVQRCFRPRVGTALAAQELLWRLVTLGHGRFKLICPPTGRPADTFVLFEAEG